MKEEVLVPLTPNQQYLISRYERYIRQIVRKRYPFIAKHVLSDLEQAAVLSVMKHVGEYDGSTKFTTFIYKIAIGGAIHWFRDREPYFNRNKVKVLSVESLADPDCSRSDEYVSELASDSNAGINSAGSMHGAINVDAIAVKMYVDTMEATDRIIFRKYFEEKGNYTNTGRETGLAASAVKAKVLNIRTQLMEVLNG